MKKHTAILMALLGLCTMASAIPTVTVSVDQGNTWTTYSPNHPVVGSWRIYATPSSDAFGFDSFNAVSRLPGILMVRLSDKLPTHQSANYYSIIDGTIEGGSRLLVNTYVDTHPLTTQGYFLAGDFSDVERNQVPRGQSLTFQATICQRVGGGIVDFSSVITHRSPGGDDDDDGGCKVPDSGGTLPMMGAGLLGLFLIHRVTQVPKK